MSAQRLTPQQTEAFEKFSRLKVGALFMKQGTGKTRTALELVKYNHDRVDMLLWIAPKSAIDVSILPEIEKWGCPVPYLTVGYETLSGSDRRYLETLEAVKDKRVFIVADESIFIKNGMTKRTRRCNNIREHAEYALILNGTPLVKDEWDLYNQMQFLSPNILDMTPNEFRARFFTKHIRKHAWEREHIWYTFSQVNAEALSKMVEPYIFNCDLNFTNKESTQHVYIPYDGDEYYTLREELLDTPTEDFSRVCAYLQKMNAAAARYQTKNIKVAEHARRRKCIIFGGYIDEINQIANVCDSYLITGSTVHQERRNIIKRWERDDRPLILTFGVGAYSLNLQSANEIVYSSLTYNYAHYDQSSYRIKRLGQTEDIHYTHILTDVKIQAMIMRNIAKKETLSEIVKKKIQDGDVKQWLINNT